MCSSSQSGVTELSFCCDILDIFIISITRPYKNGCSYVLLLSIIKLFLYSVTNDSCQMHYNTSLVFRLSTEEPGNKATSHYQAGDLPPSSAGPSVTEGSPISWRVERTVRCM